MEGDKKHTVTLERRENISVTGILDVISFDEDTVVVDTSMGVLVLRGAGLHVNRLNLDDGSLNVDGEISSITYEESGSRRGKSAFLGKLFK